MASVRKYKNVLLGRVKVPDNDAVIDETTDEGKIEKNYKKVISRHTWI